jgi:preprotein translocase subunit SecY
MTPPRGLVNAVEDPMHAIGYILILTLLSIIFAIAWVNTSGMDARSQAENLVRSGIQIPGFRSSVQVIESMLNRYIPTLTWFSGLIVGLLAAFADILGALGTGMGILLAVGIVNQFYQILAAQRLEEEYPAVARILGLR